MISESSVGVGAAMMVISLPDHESIVLLTVPTAESQPTPDAAHQVVDGIEIMLGEGERILTSDCMLDGRFADGRVIAVIPGEPETGENIPVRVAWLANEGDTSLDDLAPTRLTCSLSNPD